MRLNEIEAKEGGVSKCLILCPNGQELCRVWLSRGPRQEKEGCALGLPPFLSKVDRAVFGSSPHSARECKVSVGQPSMLRQ